MEGDPDVDLVHGLPEEERAEGHPEEGRHPHHLLPLRSLAPADLVDLATAARGDGRVTSNRRPGIGFWAEWSGPRESGGQLSWASFPFKPGLSSESSEDKFFSFFFSKNKALLIYIFLKKSIVFTQLKF